ncbi:fluoride efflux transporter CrcB [Sphingomicrobium astaxanthinifaciens]|uniref:fluoride efflux transporter CrcB n=1 Tax=Sphingomicrobium astaxanthinifaciens TaxID=1227949 RepID=UPI001FCC55AE|nr:fluoride efflux transporter CrcB [Sphingomicrobium astaxanthinifaciens]MCJ7421042.1 fluoride efflux transporter CrcB [Sphingomicrobium astaxanthinifaciens]
MGHALAVFLGGGLGALARWGVGKWALAWFGYGFPVGTLAVNVVGSLAIGIAVGALEGVGQPAKLFFVTGLLGGFTTFSAFSLDTLTLWERGQAGLALAYVAGTLVLSLGACLLGFLLAR